MKKSLACELRRGCIFKSTNGRMTKVTSVSFIKDSFIAFLGEEIESGARTTTAFHKGTKMTVYSSDDLNLMNIGK